MTDQAEHTPAFSVLGDLGGQLVATAVHAGHDLRPEVAQEMVQTDMVGAIREAISATSTH